MFGRGTVTKEPTKRKEGVMSFSCTECGYTKEEKIPKLTGGHIHEYSSVVTEATCETGGYTTHSCSCGHTYTDEQTPAVKHRYEYKHTVTDHWQECVYCKTVTEKTAHKLSGWKTIVKPGYTFDGEKQRQCKLCGYVVKESIPALSVPDGKVVIVITPSDSTAAGSAEPSAPKQELVTKGEENKVPALPTLPPKEDGNIFDGWRDKATGEAVKKGDMLTENIEIEPVWKDCGEGKHADADKDDSCDECGYIMVKPALPEEPTESKENIPEAPTTDVPPTDEVDGEKPKGAIGIIAAVAALLAGGGGTWYVIMRKKKMGEVSPSEDSTSPSDNTPET